MLLKNKNIVISGCMSGIGLTTLEIFAKNGANIWACFQEETPDAYKHIEYLQNEYNIWIDPLFFDFENIEQIKSAARSIHQKKEWVDALVNIAGIVKDALFHMVTMSDLQRIFEINFNSQILFTQFISKIMVRQKSGTIIFTSSITAIDGNSGQLSYGASKSAFTSVVKTLALELGPIGIRVNAVAPGVINTEMTRKLENESISNIVNKTSLNRIGTPDEVANLLMFLSSDLSSYITGQIIRIDGGVS